ncbi:MAG: Crp/Fnr family transcriptional regulator [Pedobacter sp.]|nr:MAG: Crp/Fnr family transcriptional regulator [Pedobacter sp.]
MESDILIQYFREFFPLNKVEISAIKEHVISRQIRRKQFLLQQDEICKHYSFIITGCFKMYVLDKKGAEHILQFAAEKEWITDLAGFYSGEPSRMFIEAMEPSVVLQINKPALLSLFTLHHKFDRNFRIITERKFIEQQDRILQNISTTAAERYSAFTARYHHLVNRIPNTQIAAYLGVTPEFLSKVRKKLASGKT